jgi:hypothetical protein
VWTANTVMSREDFQKRLHLLRRVLAVCKDGTLLLFHHSFAEWLLDVKHCTQKYLCSASEGHAMLAMSHTLRAHQLTADEVQGYALHLSRLPPLPASAASDLASSCLLDYHHIVLLWLIGSGAPVEDCLLQVRSCSSVLESVCHPHNCISAAFRLNK